jgi:hypothetical protein
MRIMIPRKLILLSALAAVPCWGCGAAGGGAATALISVKGKVLYKGQPVTKGSVKFEPDGYGREAHGEIKPDGTFTLTTYKDGDGIIAGEHRVAVTGTGIKSTKDALAKKYGNVSSSGLTATVDADHTDFTFELE